MELGYLDKYFFKNTGKKRPVGKNFGVFLLDTLKTTFWMEKLTQNWTQLGLLSPKIGETFLIFKKGQGKPPPLVAHLDTWSNEPAIVWSMITIQHCIFYEQIDAGEWRMG